MRSRVGFGKVLRVNLNCQSWHAELVPRPWLALWHGARGLGARYLLAETAQGLDPLSPENPLIFATGPLTATPVPCASKLAVVTKSPATRTILDCSIGGHAAAALRLSGWDLVIVTGKAREPVYMVVTGEGVQFHSAEGMWGKGIHETENRLLARHHSKDGGVVSVLAIGPAGENLVPYACIGSEKFRQAGRGGAGAVMGSKNLKAVVFKGDFEGIGLPDVARAMERIYGITREEVVPKGQWAYDFGTPLLVDACNSVGVLPTLDFTRGSFDKAQFINAESVKQVRVHKKACFGCLIGCGNVVNVGGVIVEGPDYETLSLGGSNCGIGDLKAVCQFNVLCDDLGLDTISTGNVIGLAMHITEKGISDLGVRFGDIGKYLELPKLIAERRGLGALLSLGGKKMAEEMGVPSMAMEVKGLEMPGYDPRGSWGMGLAYATSDRGGCHMRAFTVGREALGDLNPFTTEEKAAITIEKQNYNAIKWSLPICDFWGIDYEKMAEVLNLVLGTQCTAEEMKIAGERIYNLTRIFNVREGFRRDTLPPRCFEEPLGEAKRATGKVIPRGAFEEMLSEYYALRGWTEAGVPTKRKLAELGLGDEEDLMKWGA